MLDDNDIELVDINGNTAFCIAAAAGNIEIVDLMLKRNPILPIKRGGNGNTPIQYAALQGRCKMTWHLYDETIHCFAEKDWGLLFFACIYTGIYGKYYKSVFKSIQRVSPRSLNVVSQRIDFVIQKGLTAQLIAHLHFIHV